MGLDAQYDPEIRYRFAFHPANEVSGPQHEMVRDSAGQLGQFLIEALPDGREKSLALTKLEESMFWANAAIARSNPIAE